MHFLQHDFEIEEWKMEHKMFLERKMLMKSNIKKLYALVWGQCTQELKSELMGLKKYEENEKKANTLWLLENIKVVSAASDDQIKESEEKEKAIFFLLH